MYGHHSTEELQLLKAHPQIGEVAREKIDAELARRSDAPEQSVSTAPAPVRIMLTLPWTALASDNLRKAVLAVEDREKRKRVKLARARALEVLREQYGEGRAKMSGQVRIRFDFYMPDNRPRDPANFVKVACDVLREVVIEDDKWQVARGGSWDVPAIDPDRPRAEIHIEPYEPTARE